MKSLFIHPLFKSFTPLLVGGSYHLFKEILSAWSATTPNQDFDGFQQKLTTDRAFDSQTSTEEVLSNFFSRVNQISFGIYSNFFAFLIVMLLIDALLNLIKLGMKDFLKEAKSSRLSADDENSTQRKGVAYQISENQILRIFSYALIFISLQISGLCLSFVQSGVLNLHQDPLATFESSQDSEKFSSFGLMNDDQENYFGMPRILEEKEEGVLDNELVSTLPSPPLTSDKISLSMGNVLGLLNLNVNAMILSKDRRIAYVTLDLYGTLKVVDISDLQSPFVIGTLNLESSTYSYRVKNMLLSSDEKTLYASNSRDLEIIDVTDPSSPKLISLTKSEIFVDKIYGFNKNSLAVQERTKTLYIGGLGLQIYDISDPKKPALLKAVTNDQERALTPTRNEVCLSRDEEVLFVANGTLDIYNISNPKDMKLLHSLHIASSPRSILLSEDSRTALLVGVTDYPYDVVFEEMDISDYNSISVLKTIKLGYQSFYSPYFLAVSPNKSKIFIYATFNSKNDDVLVFDRVKQTTIKNGKSLVESPQAMNFSPDGKTLITASNGQFMTIELFLDYPNSRIFSESLDNFVSNFSLPTKCSKMQISHDGKYLFILRTLTEDYLSDDQIFEIWDIKSTNESRFISSYKWEEAIKQIYLTKDSETAYLIGDNSLLVLDIKDRSSINVKKTYNAFDNKQKFLHFTTSLDEKTGFLLSSTYEEEKVGYLSSFDLSQTSLSTIQVSVKLDTEFKLPNSKLIVKDDKALIIILQGGFLMYDISNLDSPTQIASLPFGLNEQEPDTFSPVLSPNKKTLYIETADKTEVHKLRIYDVSISASPQLISEKDLSKRRRHAYRPGLALSPDLKSGFIYQENSLLRLNLTNSKDVKVSGIVPLFSDKTKQVSNFLISPDGQTIYASVGKEISIINMNIKYTLFLKQEKFLLGEKYSGKAAILKLTGASDYNLVDSESYKITKLSLLGINIVTNNLSAEVTTSSLPSWISFDRESDSLTVEAKKQRDIGAYTFHSAFSLKIPRDAFKDLDVSSRDLWAWLISLNYVDNELFLTANFGSEDNFFLPEKFENSTREIYAILKQFYFETCTGFEIASSLKFEVKKNALAVSTLSTNNLKVEIKLEPKSLSEAKFVSRSYGSLLPMLKDNNKTKIALEGTIKEIDTALNAIIVNFENGTLCDASIVLNDGFNPQVLWELKNISRYFKANKHPYVNSLAKTVQEQIDSADILTGTYFTFPFAEDTFGDEYAEHLNYEIVKANNKTAFPSWLSLDRLTLKGTPPEEILGRDIDLILIAKNEFKQERVPFKLRIRLSSVFLLKLLMRYSPYILTLIGLFVSANKIFNILKKRDYKHGKEFYVGVGEEISANVIFPISFIKEENKQSQLVLKQLMLRGNVNVTEFIDPSRQIIDKEKVISAIKETIQSMPINNRNQITLYPNPIIDQIIVNKFIWMQFDSKAEVKTRELFEDLRAYCLEVVERDSSGFIVSQSKLNRLIKKVQMPPVERNETLEESLIIHDSILPGVNINLLKDAILAFAFENHSLDVAPLDIDISLKQKVPSNALFRLLKLDLRDVHLNDKNKIDYGINYRTINDKLAFHGTVQDYFKGKTLVVQIKNLHQRIMKEIWIHGVSNDFQRDEIFMIRGEQEARGQGYEIY